MDFLRHLYTDLTCENSLYFISFLLGSFLIGWLANYFASRRRIRNQEEALERSKLELKQSLKLRDSLKEKYDLKEADYQKASLSLIDRTKNINTLEADKKRLNGRLQTTLDQYEKIKVEQTQTTARLEEMNDQVLGLRTKNAQLNTEIKNYSNTINQYADTQVDNTRLKELENIVLNLREENKVLKSETQINKETSKEYEVLEQKLAALEAEKEKWEESRSEITQLEEGNEVLNAAIAQLIKENETLKSSVVDDLDGTAPEPSTSMPVEASSISEVNWADMSATEAKAQIKSMIGTSLKFAAPTEKDDLKKIQGIGPFIEEKLNDLGIYTYEQISQLDEKMIPTLTAAIEFFPGRIERDEWVNQADRLFFMKNRDSSPATPVRRVISRTVVTRPSEERFVGEKKAIQEKIIIDSDKSTPQRITRVVRREPIQRVERIVRRVPLNMEDISAVEKVETPIPPKEEDILSINSEIETTPEVPIASQEEDIPETPTPVPAASPGLKEFVSRKIVIPPVPVAEESEPTTLEEEVTEMSEEDIINELFEQTSSLTEETPEPEELPTIEEMESVIESEVPVEEETVEAVTDEAENIAKEVGFDPEWEGIEGETITETEEEIPATSASASSKEEVIDDLKVIEGIGPKIADLLKNAGIFSYAQLASKTLEELQEILDDAGPRFRIARPKNWGEQAELAAAGKWEELKTLQDNL